MRPSLLLVTLAFAACQSSEVEYSIELRTEPELTVAYTLTVPAAADGTTVFEVDENWGGVANAAELALDVRVVDASGQSLAIQKPQPHQWQVRAEASERLTASWHLAANDFQADSNPRVHYQPILTPTLFHMIGNLGLLQAQHLTDDRPRRIAVRWRGFQEAGWKVASSFSLDPAGFEITAPLHEVRNAVYLAGALRIYEVDVRGRPVGVAMAGEEWSFRDEDFLADVQTIVAAERAFFADDDFGFYLVSLIPVGVANPQSRSLGGTGLVQSFALFLQPDTRLGSRTGEEFSVHVLLAHEMFHHWNGRIIGRADPEELVYWFSEGFTDFYARRILHRAGYGGSEEYASNLNRKLRDYWLSPACTASNAEIQTDFWRNPDVGQLPYLRGDLVALLLDAEIRRSSDGAQSLDDFMRDAVERGRAGERVSTDSLLARVEEWTDAAFAQRLWEIVVEGRMVTIDAELFAPCFELTFEDMPAFDPGFDVAASMTDRVVRGLRADSAAALAGLRDGQPIVGWSMMPGRADVPIELTVQEKGEERTVRWQPQGQVLRVPQLRPVAGWSRYLDL
jgi:predicted metalloprotease with PDZ domain